MAQHSRLLLFMLIFAHLMRIFGIFPYRYDRMEQQPRVSLGWRIYSGVLLSTNVVIFTAFWVYVIFRFTDVDDHLMDFVRLSEVVIISCTFVSIVVTEQVFFASSFSITSKVHLQLRTIVEDFASSNPPKVVDEWLNRRVTWMAWLFSVRTIALVILCESVGVNKFQAIFTILPSGLNHFAFVLLLLPFVALSLISAKLCIYVHAFDHGFKLLNKQIELMVRKLNATVALNHPHQPNERVGSVNLIRSGQKYESQKLMFEFQELAQQVRLKHDALCELVEEFFRHWAQFVLVYLISNFSLLVIEAFFLFTNFHGSIRNKQPVDVVFALLNTRAVFMCAFELTWMIGACSNLMDNMQRIGVILNALVLPNLDAGVVQSMEVWTIKLLSQPNAVQVYQLFDINNGLLYSIMGAVCGYLVILIQFKLADLSPTTATETRSYIQADPTT